MEDEQRQKVAKKLHEFGLQKFIQQNKLELCNRTMETSKLAAFYEMSESTKSRINHPPEAFEKNSLLYFYIEKLDNATLTFCQKFLNALCATDNNHILKYILDYQFIAIIQPELKSICGKSCNWGQFVAALREENVISPKEYERGDFSSLYAAVIQERAWAKLWVALSHSRNQEVIDYLAGKEIQWDLVVTPELELSTKEALQTSNAFKSQGRKRFRPALADISASCVIDNGENKSSFSYTSPTNDPRLTDFIPSRETTNVHISRLNVEIMDLIQILRNCKGNIQSLTLYNVSIVNINSQPPSFDFWKENSHDLPFQRLKKVSIHLARKDPFVLTDKDSFKQTFFFNPSGAHQLCTLWEQGKTIDFIYYDKRQFKVSPKEGLLFLQNRMWEFLHAHEFFQNQLQQSTLKSFSGYNLPLKVEDIPKSVERLHLKNFSKIKSTQKFDRFTCLQKLVISAGAGDQVWTLNCHDLINCSLLESIAVQEVKVTNFQIITDDSTSNKFPKLTHIWFDGCAVFEDERVPKTVGSKLHMEKKGLEWSFSDVDGPSFEESLNLAFQTSDFNIEVE